MLLQPGDRFGRYEIVAILGRGGMGEVYRARDVVLHRRVALKVLHADAMSLGSGSKPESGGAARILREARAAAAIEHPNAIGIYDVGEVDGVPFLAMEFVAGTTLRAYVGDPSISLARRIRWLIDVARALGAAHALGLVHRDIKPENVMLREDGAIKVLDFGIARRAASPDATGPAESTALGTLSADGVVVGTPLYMAPEQMRGEPLDGRADQFSWGVLAYELLTGSVPWSREGGSLQVVAQILSGDPRPLRARDPEIPEAVERAVLKAMAKSPRDRFVAIDDAAAELEPHASPGGHSGARSGSRPPVSSAEALAPTEMQPSGLRAPGSGASARVSRISPAPSWARWLAAVTAIVVFAAAVLASRLLAPRAPIAPRSAPDAAASASQMSANPQATAAYDAGMQAYRDGSLGAARTHLSRAIELDPLFAAARLRRALLPSEETLPDVAHDLEIAHNARAALGDHDRAILDAVAPRTWVPPDYAETARRLEALAKGTPRDADLAMLLGTSLRDAGEYARAQVAFDAAIAADPSLAIGWCMKARELVNLDDAEGAMSAYRECLHVSPSATSCLEDLATLQAREGKCDEVVQSARRLIAVAPDQSEPYDLLAQALAAEGQTEEAAMTALAQSWQRMPAASREIRKKDDMACLAILRGRFDEADRLDGQLEDAIRAEPGEVVHFVVSYERMLLRLETGRSADAVRLANDYLARRAAWQRDELAEEPTMFVYDVLRQAGAMDDATFRAHRDEWLARDRARRLGATLGPGQWQQAYALPARSPAEAEVAISLRPPGRVGDPLSEIMAEENETVGRVYLLAGRIDDAVTYLTRASGACFALAAWAPEYSTWALAELGEADERRGDTSAACAAYHRVLERWGAATPPSRTAARVVARSRALRCQ